MKYTVIYKDTGDVLAVVSEQSDIKNIKIDTFDIPDNHIIDSIDVSNKEHTAVTHATPMAKLHEELEATNKRLEELNRKRSEETEEMRKAILANATMMAGMIQPEEGEEDEG